MGKDRGDHRSRSAPLNGKKRVNAMLGEGSSRKPENGVRFRRERPRRTGRFRFDLHPSVGWLVPLLVFLAIALPPCGDDGAASSGTAGSARPQLLEAANATLGMDSFRVTVRGGDPPHVAESDYQAPDRARRVLGGGEWGELVTISIGPTDYLSGPDKPGFFVELPGEGVWDVLLNLDLLTSAENVSLQGSVFAFDVPAEVVPPDTLAPGPTSEDLDGEAIVEGGLVRSIVLRTESLPGVQLMVALSKFNSVAPVKAPPDDRILPEGEGLVPCEEGSSSECCYGAIAARVKIRRHGSGNMPGDEPLASLTRSAPGLGDRRVRPS